MDHPVPFVKLRGAEIYVPSIAVWAGGNEKAFLFPLVSGGPLQVVDLVFLPWYSSEAVLETLGDGFLAATETLRDFHAVFFHALEHAGAPPPHSLAPAAPY